LLTSDYLIPLPQDKWVLNHEDLVLGEQIGRVSVFHGPGSARLLTACLCPPRSLPPIHNQFSLLALPLSESQLVPLDSKSPHPKTPRRQL
jgi:hypothetical protein